MSESSWLLRAQGAWLALSRLGFARAWEAAITQDSAAQALRLSAARIPASGVRPGLLAMALGRSNPALLVECLLVCGANPNATMAGAVPQSWLCAAAMLGKPSVVNVLLANGASPDGNGAFGQTPLEACFAHWPKEGPDQDFRLCALLLLEAGAKVRSDTVSNMPLDEVVFRGLLGAGALPNREAVIKACRQLEEPALSQWLAAFDSVGWGASSGLWTDKPLAWALLSGSTQAPVADVLGALKRWGHRLEGTNAKGVPLLHAWALSGSKRHPEWGLELLTDEDLAATLEQHDGKGRTVRGILERRLETVGAIPGVSVASLEFFQHALHVVDVALRSHRLRAGLPTDTVAAGRSRL